MPAGRFFSDLAVSGHGATLRFEIANVHLCIVNSVRRAVTAEVQTAAFSFEPSGDHAATNGVTIVRNSSSLNNEFLGHRISLVPLGFSDNQLRMFNPAAFKCVLRVKNVGAEIINVTTADFELFDEIGAKRPKAERDAVFPASPVSGDHVLLLRLKPGEEIHAECVASVGTGKQHARWSPVSRCFFFNKTDPAAVAASLAASKLSAAQHATLDAHRCFYKNEFGEPSVFLFHVDVETRQAPAFVVFSAFQAMHAKLEAIRDALLLPAPSLDAHADDDDDAKVEVVSYPNMDDFYHLVIRGEDHTIGNLLQGMLYQRWIRDGASAEVAYVGYHQPHPLEDLIVLKIKCVVPGDDVRARVADGATWVMQQLSGLCEEWVEFSGLATSGIVTVKEWLLRVDRRKKLAASVAPGNIKNKAAPGNIKNKAAPGNNKAARKQPAQNEAAAPPAATDAASAADDEAEAEDEAAAAAGMDAAAGEDAADAADGHSSSGRIRDGYPLIDAAS